MSSLLISSCCWGCCIGDLTSSSGCSSFSFANATDSNGSKACSGDTSSAITGSSESFLDSE